MVIWKYELEITDNQKLYVGDKNAKVLSVSLQNGKLMIWVQLDRNCAIVGNNYLDINIIGTGNPFDADIIGDFVGTAVMPNGFVWHVFAKTKSERER